MKERTAELLDRFFNTNRDLKIIKKDILHACEMISETYKKGGKLLICGNGGSSADADHIVGELMKGFLLKRPLDIELKIKLQEYFGEKGKEISKKLQVGLPAISLNAHTALNTAFINDVDPMLNYAQQVVGYAKDEDILVGISTSGNAKNVCFAFMAAKAKDIKCIGITGENGGKLASMVDCCLMAPSNETFRIQEYHLAIYHFICAYVESEIFEE